MSKFERYNAGKSYRETEYGIQLPDGTIHWYGDGAFRSLETVIGRERYLNERADRLKGLGLHDPGVTFLTREKKTSFTKPAPLEAPSDRRSDA